MKGSDILLNRRKICTDSKISQAQILQYCPQYMYDKLSGNQGTIKMLIYIGQKYKHRIKKCNSFENSKDWLE